MSETTISCVLPLSFYQLHASFNVFSTSSVWWKDALSSGLGFSLFWLKSHLNSFIPLQNYWGDGHYSSATSKWLLLNLRNDGRQWECLWKNTPSQLQLQTFWYPTAIFYFSSSFPVVLGLHSCSTSPAVRWPHHLCADHHLPSCLYLIPCVHLQCLCPFLPPSPYFEVITTNLKWIVWPANLAAFPRIHFLSPRPSSHPFFSPLQPPMPLPTPRSQLMTWLLISLRRYKQPEEKFLML